MGGKIDDYPGFELPGKRKSCNLQDPKRCRHVSKSTAPALDREELVGALVEVNLTELQDARVEHYVADMAIPLQEKGVRTWTYTSIRRQGSRSQ